MRGALGLLTLAGLACLTSSGCGPAAREKMLRTFVDGVPEPEAQKKTQAAAEAGEPPADDKKPAAVPPSAPAAPTAHFHPPYLENQCDSCHDTQTSQKLIAQGKDLCFACHEDFTKDKPVVHYPAAEGLCTECHDPHQSPNSRMLKTALPDLCFACHDESALRGKPVHASGVTCTVCHEIHAGRKESLLK